jgi:hypothetical protein
MGVCSQANSDSCSAGGWSASALSQLDAFGRFSESRTNTSLIGYFSPLDKTKGNIEPNLLNGAKDNVFNGVFIS